MNNGAMMFLVHHGKRIIWWPTSLYRFHKLSTITIRFVASTGTVNLAVQVHEHEYTPPTTQNIQIQGMKNKTCDQSAYKTQYFGLHQWVSKQLSVRGISTFHVAERILPGTQSSLPPPIQHKHLMPPRLLRSTDRWCTGRQAQQVLSRGTGAAQPVQTNCHPEMTEASLWMTQRMCFGTSCEEMIMNPEPWWQCTD